MDNLPTAPTDVKWILATVDPHTGKYAAYLATDDGLINIPIAAGTIDLFSLLCTPEEFDHPDAFVHDSGFICCFLDEQTVQIPYKDLPRFPLSRSVPADFQIAITDFHRSVQFRDIGATDTLIVLWRPVQPGEITGAHITKLYDGRWGGGTRQRHLAGSFSPARDNREKETRSQDRTAQGTRTKDGKPRP